jgi:predicted metalloprotease
LGQFASVVLADTEDIWTKLFNEAGRTYSPPKLVLFTDWTESACGSADAAIGPFYCPIDEKVYIDLRFLQDLQAQLNAPGDFAMAYVIAHEVGHHVQQLLGTMDQVDAQLQNMSETESNQLSIRLELQADFYAGVWSHYLQELNVLEAGDIEEALNAASAVGDDRIQKQTQGYIVPDSFTHGTSEQRYRWFKKGFDTGDMNQGDTFNADRL